MIRILGNAALATRNGGMRPSEGQGKVPTENPIGSLYSECIWTLYFLQHLKGYLPSPILRKKPQQMNMSRKWGVPLMSRGTPWIGRKGDLEKPALQMKRVASRL